MAPTDEEGWVTDPDALKTILALKALQIGDWVRVRVFSPPGEWQDVQLSNTRSPEIAYRHFDMWGTDKFLAWRRPKQHSS